MLHPLKGATSFECDGCGHHASFHKMDNQQDEETERRWKSSEATSEAMQSVLHMRQEHLKASIARNDQPDAELGQIDSQKADDSDDVVEVIEHDRDTARRARKRRRTAAR